MSGKNAFCLGFNPNIQIPKYKKIYINLDGFPDVEVVEIIRDGKKLVFPTWEFWQLLKNGMNNER